MGTVGVSIIGRLGKFVASNHKDSIFSWVLLCGIGGVSVGWYLSSAFGSSGDTSGGDCVRWLVAIITAAVLVVRASTVTGRTPQAVADEARRRHV